jgi:hypothetical protein
MHPIVTHKEAFGNTFSGSAYSAMNYAQLTSCDFPFIRKTIPCSNVSMWVADVLVFLFQLILL